MPERQPEAGALPVPTPESPPPCRPLIGAQPWIILHSPDGDPGCVAAADFQELTIFNKGVDRLTIEWVDGERELGSDEFFTYPAAQLGVGVHNFVSLPYPMPQIRVISEADSPYRDWIVTDTGVGPLTFGLSLREVTGIVAVPLTRLERDTELCTSINLDNDPYSPVLVFDQNDQLLTAIDANPSDPGGTDTGETPPEFVLCNGPDTEMQGAPSRTCVGDEGPGFIAAMVRNVAADDPDGGLVVHSEPGVDGPVIGVIPHDAVGIELTGGCARVGDQAVWWELNYFGVPGWVNAYYVVAPEVLPTCGEFGDVQPVLAQEGFESFATQPTEATNERFAAIDAQVLDDCVAVVITLGEGSVDGGITELSTQVMGGVEVWHFNDTTIVSLPSGVGDDNPLVAPAPVADWSMPADGRPGMAALVVDQGDQIVFVNNNSTELPTMVTASNPARLILSYFDNAPVVNSFIKLDSFYVTPIEQAPEYVLVRGIGAAFEAHGGAFVIDADGTPVAEAEFSGDSIANSPTVGSTTFRTGNPGVAYAPFSFTIANLPVGDFELILDACGGQCDPPDTWVGIPFSVS